MHCFPTSTPAPVSPSGEPSPPAVHGQRGVGKAFRLGLVKQDDGGMPIVEYIVKYKTVSFVFCFFLMQADSKKKKQEDTSSLQAWRENAASF